MKICSYCWHPKCQCKFENYVYVDDGLADLVIALNTTFKKKKLDIYTNACCERACKTSQ